MTDISYTCVKLLQSAHYRLTGFFWW